MTPPPTTLQLDTDTKVAVASGRIFSSSTKYNPREILVSLHIPKCGGTSFDSILKQWFGFGLHRHYMDHKNVVPPVNPKMKLLFKSVVPLCIHGHFDKQEENVGVFDYYPGAKQFISMYREPLDLQVSFYSYTRQLAKEKVLYWKGKLNQGEHLGNDIDEHLETAKYDWLRFLPWKITDENYKEIINNNFLYFGLTEELDKSVKVLSEILGKKYYPVNKVNTAERLEKPSESSVRKFKENHQLEYKVYDYLKKINSSL